MPNLLYIGAGAPWAGGAGFLLRQAATLRALSALGPLHLALFNVPADAPPPPFPCQITPLSFRQLPERGKLHRACHDLLNPLPRLSRHIDLPAARSPLLSLDPATADLIVAYRIDFAHAANVLRPPNCRRLILDVDDPEHLRWRRRMEVERTPIDWRTARDLEKLRRFECNAVASAAQAWVCQDHDRAAFPRGRVHIVPNAVHVPPLPQRHHTPPVLLLLGNFIAGAGSPNADALRWFAADVWPLLRSLCPAAQCHIAGHLSDDLRSLVSMTPAMRSLGFVDSLAPAFASVRLSIAPIRFGTGTRMKILDAWAHACPVVSTTAGADGLPAADGDNILIANDPPRFAARCAELLDNPALAAAIGAAGYRTAAHHFDVAAIERRLTAIFRDFLAAPPASPAP